MNDELCGFVHRTNNDDRFDHNYQFRNNEVHGHQTKYHIDGATWNIMHTRGKEEYVNYGVTNELHLAFYKRGKVLTAF
jgi:hypothetical protein